MYHLHRAQDNPNVLVGSVVASIDGLCPAFDPTSNLNLFGHYFGLEFAHDGHSYVRGFLPFKFTSCFCLSNNLTYRLSHHATTICLDAGIPALASAKIFEQVHEQCIHICSCNFEMHEPNQYTAPAACVQTFLNGAIGTRLPDCKCWIQAYQEDPKLSAVCAFVENSGAINQCSLEATKLNANYCQALHQSNIKLEHGILFYHEPIVGSESYAKLQLVPKALRNIVFIAFHSNPLGGHLNATRTFHRIHLQFYWLYMYSYITKMYTACPGCAWQILCVANHVN
jgi:hypothetical protein